MPKQPPPPKDEWKETTIAPRPLPVQIVHRKGCTCIDYRTANQICPIHGAAFHEPK